MLQRHQWFASMLLCGLRNTQIFTCKVRHSKTEGHGVWHVAWHLQVVPFFFYRGLECLTYSWSDRAFQALFTAVYAGQSECMVLVQLWGKHVCVLTYTDSVVCS